MKNNLREKQWLLNLFLALAAIIFIARLFQLQVIKGKDYQNLADNNRIRKIKIGGPRGIIFDRHGEILAKNRPVFKLTSASGQLGEEKIISYEEALELQASGKEGSLFLDYGRDYPQAEVFGHAIGYLGEVNQKEIGENPCLPGKKYCFRPGMMVGKTGIEQFYDQQLQGEEGGELIEVNTVGKTIRRIGRVDPVSGKNLVLALDADLQRIANSQMNGKKGAVVASNPETGEILVLYSSPSFNPNLFFSSSGDAISRLVNDRENQPLFNRAIAGLYPPGSTFKIVTSVAGLEEKKITKNTLINDPGVIYVGSYKYANWYFTGYGRTEGEINLIKAIKRSTDTYFYKLGEMVGIEKLNLWTEKFGLGKTFGIDLPGEVAGLIPSPRWKEKVKGESWFLGNTYHYSIGQGDLALTPLGVNQITSAVANAGKICRPRMLKTDAEDKAIDCSEIGIKKETLAVIKEGMVEACSSGGTAFPFFEWNEKNTNNQIACKTGTAEYVGSEGKIQTHAWFSAFAGDGERGKIAVTVLVEAGGEGSSVAAPIAKEILTEYFK